VAVALLMNVVFTSRLNAPPPYLIGVGASLGLLAGFVVLFAIIHLSRRRWLTGQ